MKAIFDRKNILVTGGAGFMGSHLCDALVKEAKVICMDNFSTSSVDNIQHLLQNPNFEFINHDITQPFELSQFPELDRFKVKFQGLQEIYHLACPISKRNFEHFKIATILTNSIGIKNVLDVAVAHQSKILYASSSALYGPRQSERPPVTEADPCVLDHLTTYGAYDEGKRFSEAILYTYADVYKLDIKIARIFRTYGPRMKLFDGNLIPDLVNAALDDKDLEINAKGDVRISLCYVSDMVDGMIKFMQTPAGTQVMNLGSEQEDSLAAVAEKIIRLTGSTSRVRFEPSASMMQESPLPSIALAKQLMHWIPLVRLDDGLLKMIEYARSYRQRMSAF